MFAYCNGNPVFYIDNCGTRPVIGGSPSTESDAERKLAFEYMRHLTTYNRLIKKLETSSKALDFIKDYEGIEYNSYYDINANLTIGYGHLIVEGEVFNEPISPLEAEALFLKDILIAESYVDYYSNEYGLSWNQNEYDALVSVTFNLPASMICILDDLHNNMDPYTAFTRDETGAFLSRRGDEANIFMYGIYERTY